MKACDDEAEKLYAMLGRKPYDVELFTCIDHAEPQAWEVAMGAEYVRRWHVARQILSALEKAVDDA